MSYISIGVRRCRGRVSSQYFSRDDRFRFIGLIFFGAVLPGSSLSPISPTTSSCPLPVKVLHGVVADDSGALPIIATHKKSATTFSQRCFSFCTLLSCGHAVWAVRCVLVLSDRRPRNTIARIRNSCPGHSVSGLPAGIHFRILPFTGRLCSAGLAPRSSFMLLNAPSELRSSSLLLRTDRSYVSRPFWFVYIFLISCLYFRQHLCKNMNNFQNI